MKITYLLYSKREKNLYCRISEGSECVDFPLGHSIEPEQWNAHREEGPYEDPCYYTLLAFKKYLSQRFHELKALGAEDVLDILRIETESSIDGLGIEGIARKMFDDRNNASGIPPYEEFLLAFEKHSQTSRGEYQPEAIDNIVNFITKKDQRFSIDTCQGLTARLKSVIDHRLYHEIVETTDENIWSEIYVSAEIQKHMFLPAMHDEWELFWKEKYADIEATVRSAKHLNDDRARSWHKFSVFMQCYEAAENAILLAWEIDSIGLYPITVVTLLNIIDPEFCYIEYCKHELKTGAYIPIDICNDEKNTSRFYIKEVGF